MNDLNGFLYFFIIVLIVIFVICYIALAMFLSRFSKKVYGEPSVMAWIPFANIYLLGKLTFNKDAGYGLVALLVLSCTLTIQINRTTIILSLPSVMQIILGAVFAGAFVATIIFGVRKYGKLNSNSSASNQNKETKSNKEIEEVVKANDDFFNN